ncbi:MAG: O-antigen/teichoic acid export membrane protein [Polaribacter sp.]
MSNQLVKHGLIYTFAQFFIMFAGLISFPILTKNLSPEDYGFIGLFTVTVSFIASFGKLGIQHSILRFRDNYDQPTFVSNIIFLSLVGPTAICVALLSMVLTWHVISPISFARIDTIVIAILVAFSEQIRALLVNFFISKQQSKLVAQIRVISKTINIILTISAILLISATSRTFIYAVIVAEVIVFSLSMLIAYKFNVFNGVSIDKVDIKIYKPIITFGIPLLGLEMVSMLHAFIDRYLIKFYLGGEPLGFYSAYYNMANIISELIIGGIVLAIVPAYMQTWNTQGKVKTEQLISKAANVFLFTYPILVASLYVISKELFTLLTTKEYATFYYLLPIVAAGVMLQSASPIFSAGLKIKKQVMTMFWIVTLSAILNFILNILFIPKYGLSAAAISTMISYSFIIISFFYFGTKALQLKIDPYLPARSILYAAIFTYLSSFIHIEVNVYQLGTKILLGVVYFCAVCLLFEKNLSTFIIQALFKRTRNE